MRFSIVDHFGYREDTTEWHQLNIGSVFLKGRLPKSERIQILILYYIMWQELKLLSFYCLVSPGDKMLWCASDHRKQNVPFKTQCLMSK